MITFLGVPILGRDGPLGNLYFTEKTGGSEFTDEDEGLAIMLASHAAVAVENARLSEEREKLVADLRSSHAARDRFFAMINHELRNAVTAVYGWSELWLRKAGNDAPRAAVEVYESAERTIALLDDLLDLSRMDAARFELSIKEADLSFVVREAVATQEPAAADKQVSLEVRGADDLIPCRTDPNRIMQIVMNLVKNAVRHSPDGSSVVTELWANGDEVCISVVDHGSGIHQENLVSIFEAYDRAGQDDHRGTGLGLTLSRALARRMGGELSVASQVGRGSRFELRLPRYQELVKESS
jgi:signal transduction histidine kinase